MEVKLSNRLHAVAAYVTKGNRLADVGTDHALIPIFLIQHNIIPRAIALDINKGPIARADRNIISHNAGQYIETRVSDGLEKLQSNEADSVVIAGMGGNLIIRILSSYMQIARGFKELILQPQSDLFAVRVFLRENHFTITDENMVFEDGKYYVILHVVPEEQNLHESDTQFISQKIYDNYGYHLIKKRHPILRQYLLRQELKLNHIQAQMKENENTDKIEKRIQEIQEELKLIDGVLSVIGR